jgi:hypothetical protein
MTLLPGQADEEIKATLQVFSLGTSPLYEALSYIWGGPTITRDMSSNGHVFSVYRESRGGIATTTPSSRRAELLGGCYLCQLARPPRAQISSFPHGRYFQWL